MLKANKIAHVRAERDALVAADNPWVITLHYSFQDELFLYMVMDYLPGGDLIAWLIKKDIFTVQETRFYGAELLLAVDSIHAMNYVHRFVVFPPSEWVLCSLEITSFSDIKPDNIVLDDRGHIRLTDFGLCKLVEANATPPATDWSTGGGASAAFEPNAQDSQASLRQKILQQQQQAGKAVRSRHLVRERHLFQSDLIRTQYFPSISYTALSVLQTTWPLKSSTMKDTDVRVSIGVSV